MPLAGPNVAKVLADYTALLVHDVTYNGWVTETANRKAYYIRGYTWFKEHILKPLDMNITDCKSEIPRAKEILASRTDWQKGDFNWTNPLAPSQIHYAVSTTKKKPVQFQKAVESIVVFEAISERIKGFTSVDVYNHVRIEAAVSYINDLTVGTLETMRSRSPTVFDRLRAHTGQDTNAVFYDMADKKTVTHKLAFGAWEFIKVNFPDILIGDIGYRYNNRYKFTPSGNENIDVPTPPSLLT